MRLFLAATTLTLILGFGTVAALADSPAPGATLHAAASDVRAPDGGQFVSLDRAFQRLELEAQIEDFYAELSREAQDLGRLERLELFYEAEAELRALVQGSETYAGEHRLKGEDYLAKARHVLAYHLGLDETPAQVTPFS